jgi:hypothetical protein
MKFHPPKFFGTAAGFLRWAEIIPWLKFPRVRESISKMRPARLPFKTAAAGFARCFRPEWFTQSGSGRSFPARTKLTPQS